MSDVYTVTLVGADLTVFINDLRDGLGGELANKVADELSAQIPIPVPVKIGAVVRTYGMFADDGPDAGAVFLRWATDNTTHSPWVEAGNHEQPYRTDQIGRITEVLSPGVDL